MEYNKKTMKNLFLLVGFGVLLYWALQNIAMLGSIFAALLGLLSPFLLGGCIAFILNVPMRRIESALFPKANKKWQKQLKRPLSLSLTLLLLVAAIGIIFGLIIPELGSSFTMLKDNIIRFLSDLEEQHPAFLDQFISYLPTAEELSNINWEDIAQNLFTFLSSGAGNLINSTVNVASRIFSGLTSFFLGFVFAMYLLIQKETMAKTSKRLLYAYLPEANADRVLSIARLSSKTFSNFLSGQCLEAVVLGTIFFIAMTIFSFPYALMISVLIAVTALIPVFGAFIGCVIGAFMILMTGGIMQTLWFVVMFLILQQLEGNFIYPKVVGNSIGLPPLWVFAAVTLGGSAMGVAGMLLFIPLCSVLYTLLHESVEQRLKEKKIPKGKTL